MSNSLVDWQHYKIKQNYKLVFTQNIKRNRLCPIEWFLTCYECACVFTRLRVDAIHGLLNSDRCLWVGVTVGRLCIGGVAWRWACEVTERPDTLVPGRVVTSRTLQVGVGVCVASMNRQNNTFKMSYRYQTRRNTVLNFE